MPIPNVALTLLAACLGSVQVPGKPVAEPPPYDPLALAADGPESEIQVYDYVVHDGERERDIPLRVYLPEGADPAPVLLFSHGLGGSRRNCAYLGQHWATRGYLAVFLEHPGSAEGVWKDLPRRERLAALRKAASLENMLLRVKDVPVVLDQLERWNAQEDQRLYGRVDLSRVGMSGHSFGAITTQAVGGQCFGRGKALFTDERIRAALALSPSPPKRGEPEDAFGAVKIPWMLMTGTRDASIIGGASPTARQEVYPALPESTARYELVLEKAEHSAFTERPLPGDKQARNPNHHRAVLALSTAFWDAYLREDAAALEWLVGAGPRTVLEEADAWRFAPAD